MAKHKNPKNKSQMTADDHRRRRQQIIFSIFALVIIVSMCASMVAVL